MFSGNPSALKKIVVEQCGHTDSDFLCYYEYKEEFEPEENKVKYPDPKDRWYESEMYLSVITAARLTGAEVDIDTYQSDRLEWNEEHQKYAVKREVFNCGDPEKDEKNYQRQFHTPKHGYCEWSDEYRKYIYTRKAFNSGDTELDEKAYQQQFE